MHTLRPFSELELLPHNLAQPTRICLPSWHATIAKGPPPFKLTDNVKTIVAVIYGRSVATRCGQSPIKKTALASRPCRLAAIKEWHSAHAVSACPENVRNKIGRAGNQRRCRALAGHHNDYAGIAIKIAEQFNGRRSVSVEHAVKIQRQDSVNGRHSPRPHCPSNLGSKLRFVLPRLRVQQMCRLLSWWMLRRLWPGLLHRS